MQEKTKLCGPLRCLGRSWTTLRRMERKEIKSEQLRNEASLNCASLRSRVHYVARRGLSRVEMNALRAPWTALSAPVGKCCHFLLDTADAFIDGQLSRQLSRNFLQARYQELLMDKRLLSASVNASMPELGSIRSICGRNLLRLLSQRPARTAPRNSDLPSASYRIYPIAVRFCPC